MSWWWERGIQMSWRWEGGIQMEVVGGWEMYEYVASF